MVLRSNTATAMIALACYLPVFHAVAAGEENQPPQPSVHSSSFQIRAYPDHLPERQKLGNDPLPTSGLVIDYYPFDESGFRVSAGAYGTDTNRISDVYSGVDNKTFLGLGWKKLLDDANRLDVSVEVGAFIGEESLNDPTSSGQSESAYSNDSIESIEDSIKSIQPVISLGIQYKF